MSGAEAFLFGCIGGLMPELLQMIQAGNRENIPAHFKKWWWWVTFVVSIAVGGFAAFLLDANARPDAFVFGFAAPEALRRLVGAGGSRPTPTPPVTTASAPSNPAEYLA